MSFTPEQIIDAYRLARHTQWRYNLEMFEKSILRNIHTKVDTARRQIVSELESVLRKVSSRNHALAVLEELDDMSIGLISTLGKDMREAAAIVGSSSMRESYENVSLGGRADAINNVALSPAQFNAFLTSAPIDGLLIPQWVAAAYGNTVRNGMQEEILGALQVGILLSLIHISEPTRPY